MLKTRILTALILLPIIILCIYFLSPLYYAIALAVIMALGAWEWSKFLALKSLLFRFYYVLTILIGIFLVTWLPATIFLSIGIAMFLWSMLAIVAYQTKSTSLGFQFPELRIVMGMLVLIPCWVGFVALRDYPGLGPSWVLMALLISWAADTGGYFAGRFWGRRPLASKVSPKKTLAGLAGSVALGMVIAITGGYFITSSWREWLLFWLVALVTILFAIIGDLTVSLLKRHAGLKDSSQIIPGHGGILDRVDSIAAAIVVFALGVILLKL